MNEEKKNITYRVIENKPYKLFRKTHNGVDYYNILVSIKDWTNKTTKYYQRVQFKRGLVIPPTGTRIKIKKAIENWYGNIYKPDRIYLILDFDVVTYGNNDDPYSEYSDELQNSDDYIDNDFLD